MHSDTRSRGCPQKDSQKRLCLIVFLLVPILLCALGNTVSAQPGRHRTVLVLYSSFEGLKFSEDYEPPFLRTLRSDPSVPVDVYAEHIDFFRFENPEYTGVMLEVLRTKYAGVGVDVIVAAWEPAIRLALLARERVFPGVPIVFGPLETRWAGAFAEYPDLTGALGHFDVAATVDLALRLQPDTRRVAVVVGSSKYEQFWRRHILDDVSTFRDRVEVIDLTGLTLDDLLQRASTLPDRTVIFWGAFWEDASGNKFVPGDALARVRAVTRAPIYSGLSQDLGHGIVGGKLVGWSRLGEETAKLVLRILKGERAGDIPFVGAIENPVEIDWAEVTRLGIDPSRIPAGATIVNREPSIWEEFGWYILGAVAVILVQALLIAGLLVQRRHRRRAQNLLAERLRFEQLVADVSARFVDLPVEAIDDEIDRALEAIRDLLGVDRASLIAFEDDLARAHVKRSAVSTGSEQLPAVVDLHEAPRAVDMVEHGKVFAFERLEELGSEYARERQLFERHGVLSHISIPLAAAGRTLGTLSLATLREHRRWGDELTPRLKLLGSIFANALLRKMAAEELQRSEAEVEQRRRELAHVARVSTLGELAASLAHELNQPLTGVLTNAQAALRLLSKGSPDLAEVRESLRDIVDDDKRAGEVIRRLRAMLQHGAVDSAVMDLNATVLEVRKLVGSDAVMRSVAMRLELDEELPPVRGDRIQLQQVILNLVVNAMDAMKGTPAKERQVTIRTSANGDGVARMEVRDEGTGIEPDRLEQIFQPFYTTKMAHGMGMGLSIARTIVAAHGGRLWAVNNPDRGATFVLTLPTADAPE